MTNLRRRRGSIRAIIAIAATSALACTIGACGSTGVGNPDLNTSEAALVVDARDGTAAGDTATSLVAVPTIGLDSAAKIATADGAASSAEIAVNAFSPAGCATKSHTTGTGIVTYTFAPVGGVPCTGPLGLEAIEGTVTATFSTASTGGVDVTVASSSLKLRGVPVTHQASANVSFSSGVRTTHWTGSYTGQNLRGEAVSHQADYTWSYDTSSTCLSLDGSSTTSLSAPTGTRTHSTAISGYVRCKGRNACPEADGTLVVTRADKQVHLVVTFLGGTSYTVAVPSRDVLVQRDDLVCTP